MCVGNTPPPRPFFRDGNNNIINYVIICIVVVANRVGGESHIRYIIFYACTRNEQIIN